MCASRLAAFLSAVALLAVGAIAMRPNPPAVHETVIQEAPGTSIEELQAAAGRIERDFEARLERQRFRPTREYVMALERRIAELEAARR